MDVVRECVTLDCCNRRVHNCVPLLAHQSQQPWADRQRHGCATDGTHLCCLCVSTMDAVHTSRHQRTNLPSCCCYNFCLSSLRPLTRQGKARICSQATEMRASLLVSGIHSWKLPFLVCSLLWRQ